MAEKIDDPSLKAIVKWRNHRSILAIASEYKNRAIFSFNFVSKEDVLAVILKISKSIDNFFAGAICFYFNKSLENGKFSNSLKLTNITPVFEKGTLPSKNNGSFI